MINIRQFLLTPLSLCLLPISVQAAGLWLYEQAAPDNGLASTQIERVKMLSEKKVHN